MAAERFSPHDDVDGRPEDEFRGGRRDWRRWWDDKAEALDPERWKAMASAWSCLWQDAVKRSEDEQGSRHGDQDLSLLRRRDQAGGDQVQALRHLAGPGPGVGPIRIHLGSWRSGPRPPQRVRAATAHSFHRGCDGSRRPRRSGTFLWGRPNLAADRLRRCDDLHGDHPRHRRLCDTGDPHPPRCSSRWHGPGITSKKHFGTSRN